MPQLFIRDDIILIDKDARYSADQVARLVERAVAITNRDRDQEILDINNRQRALMSATLHLMILLADISRIAACGKDKPHLISCLKAYAGERGAGDLNELAGLVTGRMDALQMAYRKHASQELSDAVLAAYEDAKRARVALEALYNGDDALLLEFARTINPLAAVRNALDCVDRGGRPEGMSPGNEWLASRAVVYRRDYPRGWWKAAERIMQVELCSPKLAPEQIEAKEALSIYFDPLLERVVHRSQCNNYMKNLVNRYRNQEKASKKGVNGTV